MPKAILFPFNINDDNQAAYAQTILLAENEKASIILFTAVLEHEFEEQIDEIYFHLLKLNGYFQTNYNHWKVKPSVAIERIIMKGDLMENLKQVVIERAPHWIISHPTSLLLNRRKLEETIGVRENIITDFL